MAINGLSFGNNDFLERYKQQQAGLVQQPKADFYTNPIRTTEANEGVKAAGASANGDFSVWNIVSPGVDKTNKADGDNFKFGEFTTATKSGNVQGVSGNPFMPNGKDGQHGQKLYFMA